MPLPMQKLDTYTFDQLVAEAQALLPRLAPGWTDYNLHDPGITLIELFAWLAEMDSYRLDRIPAAGFRAFLRLVGVEPRPAQVAETVLTFSGPEIQLPKGLQICDASKKIVFQTAEDLHVSPGRLKVMLTGPQDASLARALPSQGAGGRFRPFGAPARVGNALYLGFDQPFASDRQLSMYLWSGQDEADRQTRQRLMEEQEAMRRQAALCPPGCQPELLSWQEHYSVKTVWEYYAGADTWATLAGVQDTTRGLTLSGAVRFSVPPAQHPGLPGQPEYADYSFIRCRLVSGRYDCPPEIHALAINAVPARHVRDAGPAEYQEEGHQAAGQLIRLKDAPVVPGSTRLQVRVRGADDQWHTDGKWQEVGSWDQVGPHDRAYLLAPETGQIAFGDGRRGRLLPANPQIEISYQTGGGPAGNLAAGTLQSLAASQHNQALVPEWEQLQPKLSVEQPFAATGGAGVETLSEMKARAIATLDEPRRAVTLDDIVHLTQATPGVPVARAYALADTDPALPGLPALGSVTVIVVPDDPGARPEPGPDMLAAVARHLNRRRPLATELHVIGPGYITLGVRAQLHVEPSQDGQAICAVAGDALDRFFHSLRGGPDGQGWPPGRAVYRSEVMALLNAIHGVTYVDGVGLQVESQFERLGGNVTLHTIVRLKDAAITTSAWLHVEPVVIAGDLVDRARAAIESYLRAQYGGSRRQEATRIGASDRAQVFARLSRLAGVIRVETVAVQARAGAATHCENLEICPRSLIVAGRHELSVVGFHRGSYTRAARVTC